MSRFVPMYDLESLNEDQRQQYYLDACAFYGVPSELNLLAFIYMDSGDGAKNLVLYAKKGATDRIRDTRGITTTDLIGPVAIGGSVVFTAVGQNKDGRVERAVGVAAVEGLHGQNLAKAIMTAQTRATRRMTLQFVGGLLDESEVHNATANITQAEMPLSQLAAQAPAPAPNNEPGVEISVIEPEPAVVIQEALAAPSGAYVDLTRRRRPRKSVSADISESQPSVTPIAEDRSNLQAVLIEMAAKFKDVPPTLVRETEVAPSEPITAPQPASTAVEAKPVEPPVLATPKADLPSPDQQKAYRARWSEYVNKRLSKEGKMTPTEGIGGVSTKLRRFVLHLLPGTTEQSHLTVAEWETLLGYLDTKYEAIGAEELVKFIDGVVCA